MREAPISIWSHGALPDGVAGVLARLRRTEGVVGVAVMPDVHIAGEFCVGTVVATKGVLFPNAVGGDIGCGMLAVRFDAQAGVLREPDKAARMLGALCELCPGRRHHRKLAPSPPIELAQMALSDVHLDAVKNSQECRTQLGTLGSGNHFLELQADEAGQLWMMIHTGSRHLGQAILHRYLPRTMRLASGIMALEAESDAGRSYLRDVAVARAWARENRRLLATSAARAAENVLGIAVEMKTLFECDHNHVQPEIHRGREVFVHRKGASAAGAGVAGIVPGSMGTCSFHTVGLGCDAALRSSSHGAGRAMSRASARQKLTVSTLRRQLRGVWYDARLERDMLEEAPGAYKDVEGVMRAQAELTQVVRRLRPVLVYKGT